MTEETEIIDLNTDHTQLSTCEPPMPAEQSKCELDSTNIELVKDDQAQGYEYLSVVPDGEAGIPTGAFNFCNILLFSLIARAQLRLQTFLPKCNRWCRVEDRKTQPGKKFCEKSSIIFISRN